MNIQDYKKQLIAMVIQQPTRWAKLTPREKFTPAKTYPRFGKVSQLKKDCQLDDAFDAVLNKISSLRFARFHFQKSHESRFIKRHYKLGEYWENRMETHAI